MNNNKKGTIIVDFDNTICDSARCVVELYQKETNDYSKPYNLYKDELNWDFSPIIDSNVWDKNKITETFASQEFYDNLNMFKDCKETLRTLMDEGWEVVICTKPTKLGYGLDSKINYINNYVPNNKVIFLISDDFDKGLIKGDIIIDDHIQCLTTGDRDFRICFGNYKWNSNEELYVQKNENSKTNGLIRLDNWNDIYKFITSLK